MIFRLSVAIQEGPEEGLALPHGVHQDQTWMKMKKCTLENGFALFFLSYVPCGAKDTHHLITGKKGRNEKRERERGSLFPSFPPTFILVMGLALEREEIKRNRPGMRSAIFFFSLSRLCLALRALRTPKVQWSVRA